MIDFTVLLICTGLFLSGFTISFAIVSQFVDHAIFLNKQYETHDKFQYYFNNNFIDFSEVVDSSNDDYIEGVYEEETPAGKVIMTYDDDAGVFNYYCDRYISNKMLEVVCRGFVLKYECYNKLVDYTEEGIKRYSVLQKVLEEKEKIKQEETKSKDDDVFADMKPYNKKKSENSTNNCDIMIKTNFNKFKNCGRLENYNTTSKPKTLSEGIQQGISYNDFKNKSY